MRREVAPKQKEEEEEVVVVVVEDVKEYRWTRAHLSVSAIELS